MTSYLARTLRIPSLVLAAALQVLPLTRAALPVMQSSANVLAIIFRWAAGAAAALGSVQAVSGASTVITNPLSTNLVQGQPFSMRLTTAPDQAHYWTASGLPAGVSLSGTSGNANWSIGGTPTVTGAYNVALTAKDQASSGASRTTAATLIINIAPGASPPSIVHPPTSLTVTQGQSATFSVAANGTAPLNYQWRFKGGNLSGQTASNLVLNAVTTANAGNYDVIVSNGSGSVTSSVATLTVIVPVVPPSVAVPPASLVITQGQSAAFSVTAGGTAPFNYQWRFNAANLPGQTSSGLTINPVTTNNAGNYDVIISNSAGSITSSVATLTVIVPIVPPSVIVPPASLTVTQGQSAAFSVAANGTSPLTFQWRFKGAILSGQTTSNLVINPATTNNAGSYDVVIANSAGSVTSVLATLTVIVPGSALQITSQPLSQIVTQGQSATFSVGASGAAPLNYQWRFNGSNLGGQTSSNLVVNPATTNLAGGYDVVVGNGSGSVTSAIATLTVIVPPTPPVITLQPVSLTVTQGQDAAFLAHAGGTAPLVLNWTKNGAPLSDSARLIGSSSNFFMIKSTVTNDSGNYSVVVSNAAGVVTSAVATLTVVLPPPALAPVTLTITGSGTVSPISNGQWLQVGASYTITASPGAGFAFANWSGGVADTSPTITFVMESNLVLHATFVSDTVTFVNGTYRGLYAEDAGASFLRSGAIAVTTTAKGQYSGALIFVGRRLPFTGRFDMQGRATNAVPRARLTPLTLELALDNRDPDLINGRVTDGTWSAPFIADRAVFNAKTNPAPQAGNYTIVIPGAPGGASAPGGYGFGKITVNPDGGVRLNATLPDGMRIAQAGAVSKSGDWPMYATLYGGRGSILGWLRFANRSADDIHGTLIWTRLQQPSARIFPGGFAIECAAVGSQYAAPSPGESAVDLSDGQLVLSGGNLAEAFTNSFTLTKNKAAARGANPMGFSINAANGFFTGRAKDPVSGRMIPFRGVVLQKQNSGMGFFIRDWRSGAVTFGP